MREVVIVSAARTPVGSFNGALSSISAPRLGAAVIREAILRAGLKPKDIDEVIMGCVLPAGVGQAPARQAALFAELPNTTCAMTINKVCGSGLKATMLGAQAIIAGDAEVVVCGGMENMSLAPHLMRNSRAGFKMGNVTLEDHMVLDGLWDVYNNFHMGNAAELCAKEKHYTREAQDQFAIQSYKRAQAAISEGRFKAEIVPINVPQKKGDALLVDTDEDAFNLKEDKVGQLKPAFQKDGTVTAANASSINDGAACVILMSREKADALGIKPMAKIVAQKSAAHQPEWFTTAPVTAINQVLAKAKLTTQDIDLWEINEAFAVVTMAAIDELKLDPAKVNVNGGAIAIGHPIGASGARILTTLLYAMKSRGAKRGLATLCIGGGEASALIIENI